MEGGVLPGGEALLVGQNPVFSDQRAAAQMNPPEKFRKTIYFHYY